MLLWTDTSRGTRLHAVEQTGPEAGQLQAVGQIFPGKISNRRSVLCRDLLFACLSLPFKEKSQGGQNNLLLLRFVQVDL